MTRKSMQLGDVRSITTKGKRVRAKRRPAKVTTWRGWGIVDDDGSLTNTDEDRNVAIGNAAFWGGKLVRVIAKCTEVKP